MSTPSLAEVPGVPAVPLRRWLVAQGLLSPGEASVLGLAVVVVERLQPSNEAQTAPIDLVRDAGSSKRRRVGGYRTRETSSLCAGLEKKM